MQAINQGLTGLERGRRPIQAKQGNAVSKVKAGQQILWGRWRIGLDMEFSQNYLIVSLVDRRR